MARLLEGKVAIITGSSRGIGEGIARYLAPKGAKLVFNCASSGSRVKAEKIAEELRAAYETESNVVQADIGSIDGPAKVIEETVKAFGKQVDIIVNNAGISWLTTLEECTPESFDEHYYVNVRGPMLLVKAAMPYLPTDGSGRIVNMSSISSQIGFEQQTIYGGTKAALDSMTRTWARELRTRCTVNSLCVGPMDTDMVDSNPASFRAILKPWMQVTPLANMSDGKEERLGRVEEVAGVLGMLMLPESRWCTGSVICCNGGMVMPR